MSRTPAACTRVPLLLAIPGVEPARVQSLTSHVDVVPTLMALLGVENPTRDYALGLDLLAPGQRDWCLMADWEDLAIVDPLGKGVFPVRSSTFTETYATDLQDTPLSDPQAWFSQAGETTRQVLLDLAHFTRR